MNNIVRIVTMNDRAVEAIMAPGERERIAREWVTERLAAVMELTNGEIAIRLAALFPEKK